MSLPYTRKKCSDMKLSTFIAVVAMAGSYGSCLAATKNAAPPKWQLEPTSFMGINLEGNLKYDLNQCPSGYELPTSLCWKSYSDELYEVLGLPKVGIDNLRMNVSVVDSNIQYMQLTTYADQFGKFRDLLIQKYGKPTHAGVEVVKTKAGAAFNNERLVWQGVNITMTLSKYSNDIETSAFYIISEKAVAKAKVNSQQRTSDAASKL